MPNSDAFTVFMQELFPESVPFVLHRPPVCHDRHHQLKVAVGIVDPLTLYTGSPSP